MTNSELKFTSLREVDFTLQIPEASGNESFYFLALHKSGSVLFYNLIGDLAKEVGASEFALEPELFSQGVGLVDTPLECAQVLERPGYWFYGFRSQWLLPYIRRFRTSKRFILVRDPRDIYVSYYFSITKSHTVPEKGSVRDHLLAQRSAIAEMDVNEFVRAGKADFIMNNMRTFKNLSETFDCTVYRYEDFIFEKKKWVLDIAEKCGVEISDEAAGAIAEKHDIRPDEERPDAHVRQVTPGNYKRHLDEQSIQMLERKFRPLLKYFGYELNT